MHVTIDPGTSPVVASPSSLVELLLAIFLGRVDRILSLSRCRKRKRFFMPLQEFVVQFKTRKMLRRTLKNPFVCFWLFKR